MVGGEGLLPSPLSLSLSALVLPLPFPLLATPTRKRGLVPVVRRWIAQGDYRVQLCGRGARRELAMMGRGIISPDETGLFQLLDGILSFPFRLQYIVAIVRSFLEILGNGIVASRDPGASLWDVRAHELP